MSENKTESLMKFDMLETRMTNLESKTGNPSTIPGTSEVDAKIQALEAQFSALNRKTDPILTKMNPGLLRRFRTADEAKHWLSNQLWWLNLPEPVDMYTKGEFKGRLYAKYVSRSDAETTISKVKAASLKYDNAVFAKWDFLLPVRIERQMLSLGSDVLVSGGFDENGLWQSRDEKTLYCGSDAAFTAKVESGLLNINFEPGWEEHFKDDNMWKDGVKEKSDKLRNAKKHGKTLKNAPTKGLGKGEPKSHRG